MKIKFMKKYINLKSIFLAITSIIISGRSIAQEAVSVVEPIVKEIPIYEKFGMTSTQLFILMVSFTLLLVIIVASLASNLSHVAGYTIKKKLGGKGKVVLLLLSFFMSSTGFSAESIENPTFEIAFSDNSFWILLTFDVILVMIILYIVGVMNGMLLRIHPRKRVSQFWKSWQKTLVDSTPIESEHSILLDHDYDGIKELDNNLPPWWKYGFYATIVWAFIYLGYYHVFGGPLQQEEYETEILEGELAVAQYKADHPELVTAESVELLTDDATISKGRGIFKQYCVTCHMEGGAGGAGPNLTDKYWIYKGDIQGVFTTISEGAQNGMKAWKTQLNGNEIQAVSNYVMQLDPLLPPLGQEPKGENIYE